MSARIDHAAEARRFAAWADNPSLPPENVTAISSMAQVHATLALVEQQRIANMQVEVSRLRVTANVRAGSQSGADLSSQAYALEAQIAEGLGL